MENQMDINVSKTAHRAVELALISYGKLDGVVVNHGVLTPITRLADASIEDWKNHYDVNVFSALSIVSFPPLDQCDQITGLTQWSGQRSHSPSASHQGQDHLRILGRRY